MFVASASEHVSGSKTYFWAGAAPQPSTGTFFSNPSNPLYGTWQGFEANSGFGDAGAALSDAVSVVKVTFYVTNAPGTGNSWALKVRKNFADTTAVATISGASTSATWTGAVSFAQLDWLAVSITSSGSPAASGLVYWTIDYNPVGSDYYLLLGTVNGNQTFTAFANPCSGAGPFSGVATDNEIVVPASLTVTKIAGSQDAGSGGSTGYAYAVRKNDTTDSTAVNVLNSYAVATIASGGMAFAAGDRMVIKRSNVDGTQWLQPHWCITVVPGVSGEQMVGFGDTTIPSTSAVNYESPAGIGANAWNATESAVSIVMPDCTLSKIYSKVATAPGVRSQWAHRLRSNASDTTVVSIIAGTNTTASDTTDSATHTAGNKLSISSSPSVATTVSFDAVGAGGYVIGAATATAVATSTFAHTVGASANRLVFGLVCWDNSTGLTTSNSGFHSRSVTYNGVAMTSLGATDQGPYNGFIEWFDMAHPPTGTHNVIVTVTRLSTPVGGTWAIMFNSLSYVGVDSVAVGTAQSAASGTPSVTTVSATGSMVAALLTTEATSPGGYNQTSRSSILTTNISFGFPVSAVLGDAAGSTSVVHSESASGSPILAQALQLYNTPAPAATANVRVGFVAVHN